MKKPSTPMCRFAGRPRFLPRALRSAWAIGLMFHLAPTAPAYQNLQLRIDLNWQGTVLDWDAPTAQLEESPGLFGPWTLIPEATAPWVVTPAVPERYFRLIWLGGTNAASTAADDAFAVPAGVELAVPAPGVLANDAAPDAAGLQSYLAGGPAQGALTLNADGSFTYLPVEGFSGMDSFSYHASDGFNASPPATVTISVHAANAAPQAQPDNFTARHDRWLGVSAPGLLTNDFEPDGDVLSAVLLAEPSAGSLQLNPDGGFDYYPAAGAVGPVTFTYSATDGQLSSSPVTVTLWVTNQPPVAQADTYVARPGATASDTAAGVLRNDDDPEGDPISLRLLSATASGSLSLETNGAFVYVPSPGFQGVDSFVYAASDGMDESPPALVTILVTNEPPVGAADQYATPTGVPLQVLAPGLLANDFSSGGEPLHALLAVPPGLGVLAFEESGAFTFAPPPGFSGDVSFSYLAASPHATNPAPVSVTISVHSANGPPMAVDDLYTLRPDQRVIGDLVNGVLANDEDADGDHLHAELLAPPATGMLDFRPDGTFDYLPELGVPGPVTFAYRVSDGVVHSPSAVVTIEAVNSAPLAAPDRFDGRAGEPLEVPTPGVLANDGDDDHDPLYGELIRPPAHGQLTLHDDGSFTYEPEPGFTGVDDFTYVATDGWSTSAVTRAALSITGRPPEARPDEYGVRPDSSLHRTPPGVLTNDLSLSGGALTAELVRPPQFALSFSLLPDGSFAYTPQPGIIGVDKFSYRISDGILRSATVPVTLYVTNEPQLRVDSYFYRPGETLQVPAPAGVLANDLDFGNPGFAAIPAVWPELSLAADGSFVFTAPPLAAGTFTFPYSAVLNGAVATQPVGVKLAPVPALKVGDAKLSGVYSVKFDSHWQAAIRSTKFKVETDINNPKKDGSLRG